MNAARPAQPAGNESPAPDEHASDLARDVRHFLLQEPRQLPSRLLYDELGSALFEAICCLPWYPITRAEEKLLERHGANILQRVGPLSTVVELGTGNGRKLRTLLSAAGSGSSIRDIHLVDLSPAALTLACDTLAPLDRFAVTAHAKSYEMGLRAAAELFHDKGRVLVAFLGSNIGNFDPPASAQFLERIRRELRPGDALLLGADLVKRAEALVLAYDDPLGVTAAFNRNLLVRVNRDLGGNFEVEQYSHLALWDEAASRVEMHLVARSAQHVRIPGTGLEFSLRSGERIWTESSYKFQPEEIANRIEESGFRLVEQWIDLRDRFALTLGVVV